VRAWTGVTPSRAPNSAAWITPRPTVTYGGNAMATTSARGAAGARSSSSGRGNFPRSAGSADRSHSHSEHWGEDAGSRAVRTIPREALVVASAQTLRLERDDGFASYAHPQLDFFAAIPPMGPSGHPQGVSSLALLLRCIGNSESRRRIRSRHLRRSFGPETSSDRCAMPSGTLMIQCITPGCARGRARCWWASPP
jgi:hypothetical protein